LPGGIPPAVLRHGRAGIVNGAGLPLSTSSISHTKRGSHATSIQSLPNEGPAMKVRWALLTMAAALVLGVGAGFAFGLTARPMQVVMGCILLKEAEKAGYLDKQKISTLIDRAAEAKSLDPSARRSVLDLKKGCLN